MRAGEGQEKPSALLGYLAQPLSLSFIGCYIEQRVIVPNPGISSGNTDMIPFPSSAEVNQLNNRKQEAEKLSIFLVLISL